LKCSIKKQLAIEYCLGWYETLPLTRASLELRRNSSTLVAVTFGR
jgi:hypothetical protein